METEIKKKNRDEELWNEDIIKIISSKLKKEFPEIKIIKGKVLKDIFLCKDNKNEYQLQLGFVDQDIVIYEKTMDISDFRTVKNISLHNVKERDNLVIPKVICELKYGGITSHGLITYSYYATDIKSIFPECKYFLAIRFTSSSENKLFRHGKGFDKIISFGDHIYKHIYEPGQFVKEMKEDHKLKRKFDEFIEEIKNVLRTKKTYFVK